MRISDQCPSLLAARHRLLPKVQVSRSRRKHQGLTQLTKFSPYIPAAFISSFEEWTSVGRPHTRKRVSAISLLSSGRSGLPSVLSHHESRALVFLPS